VPTSDGKSLNVRNHRNNKANRSTRIASCTSIQTVYANLQNDSILTRNITETDFSKVSKRKPSTSRFTGLPNPVLTTSVNLSSEVMYFQRRQVPQPAALPRCYTKLLVSSVPSVDMQEGPTRLRRLDLLDLLLLDPTPPAAYWRCRLNCFSLSSYRTRLFGLGGPGDLDSRFGEKSDRTGERPSGSTRPVQ
jgi:hypothetical protein